MEEAPKLSRLQVVAYIVVIAAGVLFIANFAVENALAFTASRRAVQRVHAAIEADQIAGAGTADFMVCIAAGSPQLRKICNEQQREAYSNFGTSWANAGILSHQQVAACLQSAEADGGTNWVQAAPCARLAVG